MITLYNYQDKYVGSLRSAIKKGIKHLIVALSTGGGKTVIFSFMASKAIGRDKTVLVFTHRSELLQQAGGTFEKFHVESEFINAGSMPDLSKNVHVAMVETFHKRIDQYLEFLQSRDVIIIDEAHLQNFNKLLDLISPEQIIIGFTATPIRKGRERCFSENYSQIIQEIDTPELIKLGKLTPAISYGLEIEMKGLKKKGDDYDTTQYYDENKTYKGVIWNYEQRAKGEKTILFASNIKSSKQVCDEFIYHGYNARHIDGKTKNRKEIFEWFDKTKDAILCNCGIATTGFDQDDILTVILYRATTSLSLFMQMCGRGSRLSKGKDHFKILDFGNNIQRHGFWEQPRIWELKKAERKIAEAAIKICTKCEAMNYASAKECVVCGALFPVPKPNKTPEEVVLQLLVNHNIKGKMMSELSVIELSKCQKDKIFKHHYVWRVVRSRGMIEEYAQIMKYSNGWIRRQYGEPTGFKDKRL